eukprot:364444-Chlamydomonas_euryale.AAC.8
MSMRSVAGRKVAMRRVARRRVLRRVSRRLTRRFQGGGSCVEDAEEEVARWQGFRRVQMMRVPRRARTPVTQDRAPVTQDRAPVTQDRMAGIAQATCTLARGIRPPCCPTLHPEASSRHPPMPHLPNNCT